MWVWVWVGGRVTCWHAGRLGGGWLGGMQAVTSQPAWVAEWLGGWRQGCPRQGCEGAEAGQDPHVVGSLLEGRTGIALPRTRHKSRHKSRLAQASSPRAGCMARIRSRRSHSILVWEFHRAELSLSPGRLRIAPAPPMGPRHGPHQDPISLHHLQFQGGAGCMGTHR